MKFASRVSKERTRREQRHVWFGFVLRARFNAKEDFFAVFLSNLVLNLRKSASSSPKFIRHLAKSLKFKGLSRTAQTHVLLNAKYLNFPIRCKNSNSTFSLFFVVNMVESETS